MCKTIINMCKTTMKDYAVFKDSKFRTPMTAEKEIGLWVDRIGGGKERGVQTRMRLLGQYGAVKIESGCGTFINTVSGSRRVKIGDIMLLFPDVPSLYFPDDMWVVKWILWDGPEAALLEKMGFIDQKKSIINDFPSFDSVHTRLTQIVPSESLTAVLERKSLMLNLIRGLYELTSRGTKQNITDEVIKKSIIYIGKNSDENISIKKLAMHCNLSLNHFRRLFKAYTGCSPKEYILSAKISKAKDCLIAGYSIKETAYIIGFCDVFHFMRTFKKVTGINPGKFY